MDEEKEEKIEVETTEESQAKETVQGKDDSTDRKEKVETTPLIDVANAAAERMEKANEETARLQAVQAERDQRIALGGRAEAGTEPKTKEETDAEFTERFEKGEVNPLKE